MEEWRWWWAGELLGRLGLGAAFNFSSTSNEEGDKEERDKETRQGGQGQTCRRRCKDMEERVEEERDKCKGEGGQGGGQEQRHREEAVRMWTKTRRTWWALIEGWTYSWWWLLVFSLFTIFNIQRLFAQYFLKTLISPSTCSIHLMSLIVCN